MQDVKPIHSGTAVLCSTRAKTLQLNSSHLPGRSLARQAAAHSAARKCSRQRKCASKATATGPGPDDQSDDNSPSVDIDLLAQQLTKEAARLRSSNPQDDVPYDRPVSLEDAAAAADIEVPEQSSQERSSFSGAFGDEVLPYTVVRHSQVSGSLD